MADQLIAELDERPEGYQVWQQSFLPIALRLISPLALIFRDESRTPQHRNLSASLLAEYAHGDTSTLFELTMDATAEQFVRIRPTLEANRDQLLARFERHVNQTTTVPTPNDETISESEKDQIAKRQAHAAAMLILWEQPKIAWKFLGTGPDNRRRTYLIRRAAEFGIDPMIVAAGLRNASDQSIRAAMLLMLGATQIDGLASSVQTRSSLTHSRTVQKWLQAARSIQALKWALRQWDDTEWLEQAQN